jgi:hypothetical protein
MGEIRLDDEAHLLDPGCWLLTPLLELLELLELLDLLLYSATRSWLLAFARRLCSAQGWVPDFGR